MTSLIISVLIGGGLGALIGRFGWGNSAGSPLTANGKRGAVYGAVLGGVFYFVSGGGAYPPHKNIKTIAEADFDREVTQAGRPVVVDFYAPWCGPCKILSPRLDKLAGEFGDRVKFVAVNVDEAQSLAARFKVQGIPTVLFVGSDGKVIDATIGLLSVEDLRAKLESLVGKL